MNKVDIYQILTRKYSQKKIERMEAMNYGQLYKDENLNMYYRIKITSEDREYTSC